MNQELQSTLDVLLADGMRATDAYAVMRVAGRDAVKPTLARADALRQEAERSARAGVRVTVNAGDFATRGAAVMAEMGVQANRSASEHERYALSFNSLLCRALGLIAKMRDELDAPAHAAAVREEAETAAFWADQARRGY